MRQVLVLVLVVVAERLFRGEFFFPSIPRARGTRQEYMTQQQDIGRTLDEIFEVDFDNTAGIIVRLLAVTHWWVA